MTEYPDVRSSRSASAAVRGGRITSIRTQSRAPDRVSIFLDGRFGLGVHRDLLLEFDVAVGMELSADQQAAMLRRDAFFKARAVACRYISYRERSTLEVRRRLQRDDVPPDVIDDVLHHLQEVGLVDDLRFAAAYAEMLFRSRGYGPVRVRVALRKKGIEPAAAEAVLENVFAEGGELLDRAREAGAKRWERLRKASNTKASSVLERKKKVYDHLARRGYRFDMIRRVVDELEDL